MQAGMYVCVFVCSDVNRGQKRASYLLNVKLLVGFNHPM